MFSDVRQGVVVKGRGVVRARLVRNSVSSAEDGRTKGHEPRAAAVGPDGVRPLSLRMLPGVSLTRHLANPSSPIRGWFAGRLPHTSAVVLEANRALRLAPATSATPGELRRIPVLPTTAADPRLVGTALDLLVRATLASSRWSAAPTVGAMRLENEGIVGALDVARQTSARLQYLAPAQLLPSAGEWREVATLCVLLARFEQAGRSLQATDWVAERLRAVVGPTIAAYTIELVDTLDVADTAAAAPAIAEDHADLRTLPLRLGQTFALSGALGGADADLIAGALLLDLKAAATTRIVTRVGLWQLVGYALADTDDTCGLQRVGFSALRWRQRWIIGLDELVSRLAGETVEVSTLRRELADVAAA